MIENVRPEDSGIYKCSAEKYSNRIDSVYATITIRRNIDYPPAQIPASVQVDNTIVTIAEGQSTTIKCEPAGYPLPTIKWTKVIKLLETE